jgi:hypothetical protein
MATTSAKASSASSQFWLAICRTVSGPPGPSIRTLASNADPRGSMVRRTVKRAPEATKRTARVRESTREEKSSLRQTVVAQSSSVGIGAGRARAVDDSAHSAAISARAHHAA